MKPEVGSENHRDRVAIWRACFGYILSVEKNTARKTCFAGGRRCISSGIPCLCPNKCVTNGRR